MSEGDKPNESWRELDTAGDVTHVDGDIVGDRRAIRWKLRGDTSPWDLTFRIEITNDRETK